MRLKVMYYVRYLLILRQIEDILNEHGIDFCHTLPAGYCG